MKRYGLTAALLGFIILGIGTYYIRTSVTGNDLPSFRLSTIQGDEKAAASIDLEGFYNTGTDFAKMKINTQGSRYEANSFLNQFTFQTNSSEHFTSVISEHRQFLPGRYEPSSFYEDDKLIVYARTTNDFSSSRGSHNFRIVLSIWDKTAKEKRTVTVPLEESKELPLQWFHVDDVQMANGQFHLFTQNFSSAEGGRAITLRSVHLYTIDEASGELLSSKDLLSDNGDMEKNGSNIQFDLVSTYNPLVPSKYVVYRIREMKNEATGENSYNVIQTGEKLAAYNLSSGQLDDIVFGEGQVMPADGSGMASVIGDKLVWTVPNSLGLQIVRYDLGRKTADDTLVTSKELGGQPGGSLSLDQDKLYAGMDFGGSPGIVILDWKSGDILYRGAISVDGTPEERKLRLERLNLVNPIFHS